MSHITSSTRAEDVKIPLDSFTYQTVPWRVLSLRRKNGDGASVVMSVGPNIALVTFDVTFKSLFLECAGLG